MKLVLPDHTEVSVDDLRQIRTDAVAEWRKAERKQTLATNRMAYCESIVLGCISRMRLLKILNRTEE